MSSGASAYSDRKSLWVFQNYGYTANSLLPWDSQLTVLVDGLNDAITSEQPDENFSAYLSYVDPDLTVADAHREYHGDATYDILVAQDQVRYGFCVLESSGYRNFRDAVMQLYYDHGGIVITRAKACFSTHPASIWPTHRDSFTSRPVQFTQSWFVQAPIFRRRACN